ncbi:25574_t:CDS:2, partial [Gigaspora rosea]
FFKVRQVGWTGGLHKTIEKAFINRFATAHWYIDPHLSTLSAHSYYLPPLFAQLKTACEPHQLKDEYVQLYNLLSEKSFYEYIEIQQYLPDDAINQYKFIKELQLTFSIVEKLDAIYGNLLLSNINVSSNEWIRFQVCSTNAITTQA